MTVPGFFRWQQFLRRILPRAFTDPRRRAGRRGERLAARWLRRRGYRILHRNLMLGRAEADLVVEAPDGRTIVIVEVKTRTSRTRSPATGFGPDKQRRLVRFAQRYRRRRDAAGRPLRIDAMTVVCDGKGAPEIRHYPAAFGDSVGLGD